MNSEVENLNESQDQPLLIADVIKSVCVGCGKPVEDFDEDNNNCCDECWLSAQQTVLQRFEANRSWRLRSTKFQT